MDDSRIIELYFARSEEAIKETDRKYGAFCRKIAMNVLRNREDAEECVNDTWHQAWKNIPPQRPDQLKIWLGRVVRNCAINLWNHNHRQKRYAGMEIMLDELEECVAAEDTVETILEDEELGKVISDWLRTLSPKDRAIFIRRYWNGEEVRKLAAEFGMTANHAAQKMHRLRQSLKAYLVKEGITL